jgi:hypothetical protein
MFPMAWIENGPISLPPPTVAAMAGLAIFACALGGIGLGFSGSWRNSQAPSADTIDQAQGLDQAPIAKPIVDVTAAEQQAPAANTATADDNSASADDNEDNSASIAAQTAEAQAAQSRSSKPADIDDILTSRSEKPQAPAKPSTDENAPPSDVPF